MAHFEVDSTESVWYTSTSGKKTTHGILKLTPQSQYGIKKNVPRMTQSDFEVDSTESVWYKSRARKLNINRILKLTPQSQYGIAGFGCFVEVVVF